jgi:hypothetical protein
MGHVYSWASRDAVDALTLSEIGEYLKPTEAPSDHPESLRSGGDEDGSGALAAFASGQGVMRGRAARGTQSRRQ